MDFKCNHCNKSYKSYQSRWNHINRYHNNSTHLNPPILPPIPTKNNVVEIKCNYCNKTFTRNDSLKKHIDLNRCKKDNKDEKIEKLEKQMEELKDMLQKALKIHHPDLLEKIFDFSN